MVNKDRFDLLNVALGEGKVDLVIRNGKIVNVYTGEVLPGSIAIKNGRIIGVTFEGESPYQAEEEMEAAGRYIVPGFIDPHIHIESSAVTVTEFVKAVLPLGVTSLAEDAHEIANIVGVEGLEVFVKEAEKLPVNLFLRVPGRVPGTDPANETSGRKLTLEQTKQILAWKESVCLAGDINPYLVLRKDNEQLEKIDCAMEMQKAVSGQIAGDLTDMEINALAMAGLEDSHIAPTPDFMIYLIRNGIRVLVTHRSDYFPVECYKQLAEKIKKFKIDTRLMSFCSDDVYPHLLLDSGQLDDRIRRAIAAGIPAINAYQMATINTAEFLRIDRDFGSVSPGKVADLLIIDKLENVSVDKVIYHGKVVVSGGKLCEPLSGYPYPEHFYKTININKEFSASDFQLRVSKKTDKVKARVIQYAHPRTEAIEELSIENGIVLPDADKDIACISVVDRHSGSNRTSHGFIKGFGIKRGAIASTICHDAHNLVVLGNNFDDMALAANKLRETGGGLAAVLNGKVIALVELPICGIMSDQPMAVVGEKYKSFESTVKNVLGTSLSSPIDSIVFLCLPNLLFVAITDMGILDTQNYKILDAVLE